jgi:hypothetical protein
VRSLYARGIHDKYIHTSSTKYTQTHTQGGLGAYKQGAYIIYIYRYFEHFTHSDTHTGKVRSIYERGINDKYIDTSSPTYTQTHTQAD